MQGIKTLKGVGALQPSDVVDGDREKTLALLWRLILRFQLPQLVDAAAVRMEIDRIHTCAAGGAPGTATAPAAVPSAAACQDHVGLLLQWVQVVCAQYGAAALNFTSAFADGRVFCLLVSAGCWRPRASADDLRIPWQTGAHSSKHETHAF